MNLLLIGCVPSSGSSLLVRQLSECEGVLCLPETGLFCHGRLVAADGPASMPNDLHAGVPWVLSEAKVSEALGWNVKLEPDNGIGRSAFDVLRAHLSGHDSSLVIEKCPENVFAFDAYLGVDESNKAVLISRDLREVCQSLVRRGFNIIESLIIWFGHSYEMFKLIEEYPDQVFHCRYRDIVRHGPATVEQILNFVGHPFRRRSGRRSSGERLDVSGSSAPEQDWLRDLSNWELEDTSWSHRIDDEGPSGTTPCLLGIEFEALVDGIVFRTPSDGFVQAKFIDAALMGHPVPMPTAFEAGAPVRAVLNHRITQCLGQHFVPHLARS